MLTQPNNPTVPETPTRGGRKGKKLTNVFKICIQLGSLSSENLKKIFNMQYIPLPMKWISETLKPVRKVTYLTENKPYVKKNKVTFTHYIKML